MEESAIIEKNKSGKTHSHEQEEGFDTPLDFGLDDRRDVRSEMYNQPKHISEIHEAKVEANLSLGQKQKLKHHWPWGEPVESNSRLRPKIVQFGVTVAGGKAQAFPTSKKNIQISLKRGDFWMT